MSGFAVNISGEDINRLIAQAILDSTLGKVVKDAVDKAVNNISGNGYSYDSAVQRAVKEIVEGEMRKIVLQEYGDVLGVAIRQELEKELGPDGKLVETILTKMLYRD